MRVLLDTHILLWCLEESDKLPDKARDLLLSADIVFASTVNLWEIMIKQSIGRLELKIDMHDIIQVIEQSGFSILPIKPNHAVKLVDLEEFHRDPFDRMLIAQSLVEPLHLLTCDTIVAKYKGNIVKV
jgi:PIN domain nuclease of toxin-antitoxin system